MAHYRATIDIQQRTLAPSQPQTLRPEAGARIRPITVYTNVEKVVDNLGLVGTDRIAALIVERSGRILAREIGGFEERKAQRLAASLAPTPSSGATAA